MRTLLAATFALGLIASSSGAQAIGCLSGAAAGGVAGHYAGHHALLGAAAGCAIGHHQHKLEMQRKAAAMHHDASPTAPAQ